MPPPPDALSAGGGGASGGRMVVLTESDSFSCLRWHLVCEEGGVEI